MTDDGCLVALYEQESFGLWGVALSCHQTIFYKNFIGYPFTHAMPSNWLVLPIKPFPLINPYTWDHYWISILFEHYAPLISNFLTGHVKTLKSFDFGKRAFSHKAPNIWNSLPLLVRQRTYHSTFKRHLKTYLLSL